MKIQMICLMQGLCKYLLVSYSMLLKEYITYKISVFTKIYL